MEVLNNIEPTPSFSPDPQPASECTALTAYFSETNYIIITPSWSTKERPLCAASSSAIVTDVSRQLRFA